MKITSTLAAAAVLAGSLAVTAPAQAEPGGCLKYGAAGAVGGHLVHHGVLGAAGGCAAGAYRRHKYRQAQRAAAHAAAGGQPSVAGRTAGSGVAL